MKPSFLPPFRYIPLIEGSALAWGSCVNLPLRSAGSGMSRSQWAGQDIKQWTLSVFKLKPGFLFLPWNLCMCAVADYRRLQAAWLPGVLHPQMILNLKCFENKDSKTASEVYGCVGGQTWVTQGFCFGSLAKKPFRILHCIRQMQSQ